MSQIHHIFLANFFFYLQNMNLNFFFYFLYFFCFFYFLYFFRFFYFFNPKNIFADCVCTVLLCAGSKWWSSFDFYSLVCVFKGERIDGAAGIWFPFSCCGFIDTKSFFNICPYFFPEEKFGIKIILLIHRIMFPKWNEIIKLLKKN